MPTAERIVDRTYRWTSGELCALTFRCNYCGDPILSTVEHIRSDTHTIVNGQRIGRTYFFHLSHVPDWALI